MSWSTWLKVCALVVALSVLAADLSAELVTGSVPVAALSGCATASTVLVGGAPPACTATPTVTSLTLSGLTANTGVVAGAAGLLQSVTAVTNGVLVSGAPPTFSATPSLTSLTLSGLTANAGVAAGAAGLLQSIAAVTNGVLVSPGTTFSATPSVTTLTATTSATIGGATPTAITNVRVYAASLTPAQTAASLGVAEQIFAVTGLSTADIVFVNGPVPTALCPPVTYRVSSTNNLAIGFADLTAGLCTPAAGTYNIWAFRS